MKNSLSYLPEEKRRDLRQIAGLVRENVKDAVMVILYGSYARNTYVDYDQRTEYGVRTYFMSDYDILIITKRRMGINEHNIYEKILKQFYRHKNFEFHTHPQFINESIGEFNRQIEKGRYFFTDIKKDGVLLYDSGEYKLARRRKLNYGEIKEMAQEYFDEKYPFANRFLSNAQMDAADGEFKMASFNLHQAAENYLRIIPMVYILYGYKDHDLAALMGYCKQHTLELARIFPRNTEEEKRLFKLLQDAYVQSRYNKDFVVTETDINALMSRIKQLQGLTAEICRNQIGIYASMSMNQK